MRGWEAWLERERHRRAEASLERALTVSARPTGPLTQRGGRDLINLSSNNYLGLAQHPSLIEAARVGAARGAGAGASRLITGHDAVCELAEARLAELKGTERALLFGSGYLANVGTLAALLDRECTVLSDSLNHASLIDGIRLSGARIVRYRHADLDHLRSSLQEVSARGSRALVVTDTVFSMDGDAAPLAEIVELKESYGAALLVDDAHGGGVFGPNGEGYAHEVGVADRVDLTVGTFSKAFGAYGAYVAASTQWIEQLVNTARSLIYSTGLPPPTVSAISASIDLVRDADTRRAALTAKAERFRKRLETLGLDIGGSTTQIVPIVVGESDHALQFARALREHGILAVGIRPPSVPPDTARVRFSLMATHTDEQLDEALGAIEAVSRAMGLVS
ncbi:MAG: 8-amino-7-oxononanoate synthase [Actinomycetia bacterium]|nr:8-amino-7-oxononanoate synthase [Actinomycetes bacterium]